MGIHCRFWPIILILFTLSAVPAGAVPPPSTEHEYYPGYFAASSYLHCTWNRFEENYLPRYAMDGRKETAWVEDSPGEDASGVGEWIHFSGLVAQNASRLRIRILNGYQKSTSLYYANSRPRELEIYFNLEEYLDFTGMGAPKQAAVIKLADKLGWQEASIPLNQERLKGITLRIRSIYPGTKYSDTCLSEVQFLVSTTAPFNSDLAARNRRKNEAYIAERLEKAKNMAGLPPTGLVKPVYVQMARSAVALLPMPDAIPATINAPQAPSDENTILVTLSLPGDGEGSPEGGKVSIGSGDLRGWIHQSLDQFNTYPRAIPFLPWLRDISLVDLAFDHQPWKESLVDAKRNNYDTPFEYDDGKLLLWRFLQLTALPNKIVLTKIDDHFFSYGRSVKVRFSLGVDGQKWSGLASTYYITPCCCGGGPRWVREFRLYDGAGFLRWQYRQDSVAKRVSSFYVWDNKLPQLTRVIVLKDLDFRGEGGTYPGLMEVWE